jgi:hypothetical protein
MKVVLNKALKVKLLTAIKNGILDTDEMNCAIRDLTSQDVSLFTQGMDCSVLTDEELNNLHGLLKKVYGK